MQKVKWAVHPIEHFSARDRSVRLHQDLYSMGIYSSYSFEREEQTRIHTKTSSSTIVIPKPELSFCLWIITRPILYESPLISAIDQLTELSSVVWLFCELLFRLRISNITN